MKITESKLRKIIQNVIAETFDQPATRFAMKHDPNNVPDEIDVEEATDSDREYVDYIMKKYEFDEDTLRDNPHLADDYFENQMRDEAEYDRLINKEYSDDPMFPDDARFPTEEERYDDFDYDESYDDFEDDEYNMSDDPQLPGRFPTQQEQEDLYFSEDD